MSINTLDSRFLPPQAILIHKVSVFALILMMLVISACGITAPRSNEGYANLDSPGMNDTKRTMSLSIGPTTLRFAARFLDDDPETQTLLRSLDGVRVRTYEVVGDPQRITRNFEHMGSKLENDGWDPIVLVRDDDELVQMYAKMTRGKIRGLTIVTADDAEVVVVNVMGDIDPRYYSDVMMALNVDGAPEIQLASAD